MIKLIIASFSGFDAETRRKIAFLLTRIKAQRDARRITVPAPPSFAPMVIERHFTHDHLKFSCLYLLQSLLLPPTQKDE
jgi:hypothetical protein